MSTDPAPDAVEHALRHVAALATGPPVEPRLRVTLNFHPDRPDRDGLLVIRALARDGVYRSQFVTGLSNGGLASRPGGARGRGSSGCSAAPTTAGPRWPGPSTGR